MRGVYLPLPITTSNYSTNSTTTTCTLHPSPVVPAADAGRALEGHVLQQVRQPRLPILFVECAHIGIDLQSINMCRVVCVLPY